MKRLLLLCLLILAPAANALRPPDPSALPDISLLTFAPGEIYWQRFGHNALLVRDAAGERVYNYGIFDFRQKDFLLNFARGVMRYRLEAEPLDWTLSLYRREGRWVREQRLRLLPTQALALRDFLSENALPHNAEYRYDYFLSNCSTRVRDALDQALRGALRPQLESRITTSTYRSEATRLMSPDFWWFIGMDIVVAAKGDVPVNEWQLAFSPLALMGSLRRATLDGAPLVAEERVLVAALRDTDPPAEPPSLIWLGGAGLLLGAVLWGLSRSSQRASRLAFATLAFSLNLVAGLGGLILLGIWTLTEHWSWHANHNLLLFNPLCLLLLPAFVGAPSVISQWASRFVAAGAAFALVLPGQHNLVWVLLWLPIHAAFCFAVWHKTRHPLATL